MTDASKLARRSVVAHPSGFKFHTPLLVPSFSSKGFRVSQDWSEIRYVLELTSEFLTDSMLVSAYDLAHGHLPRPGDLEDTPQLIVVDSGGYETRIEHDLCTDRHWPHEPLPWDVNRYRAELNLWPERFPAIFVSYDAPGQVASLTDQVAAATQLFSQYPQQLHTFLLKPEAGQESLSGVISSVERNPHQLAPFHIIGVTEKELGSNLLDRMHNVARLRIALDKVNLACPIHVFGALDPMACVLFFLAGAEVFDGLTWLRYAYRDGLCVYPSNFGALAFGLGQSDFRSRARIYSGNLLYLERLADQMHKFLLDRDFSMFEHQGELFAKGYDSIRARLQGGA